jgi:hypothetical protein
MFDAKRKIHLIKEIIQIKNNALLAELEHIISKSKQFPEKSGSFSDFAGIWSIEEAEEIKKSIEESCEQINVADCK